MFSVKPKKVFFSSSSGVDNADIYSIMRAMSSQAQLEKRCRWCKGSTIVTVDPADLERWRAGELIQIAMPYLSAGERELLISGTCDVCWEGMFGDGD